MKKAEFVKFAAERLETTGKEATETLSKVFSIVEEALVEFGEVPVGDLGKLTVAERAARKGVNPKLLKELKEQGVSDEDAKRQAEVDIQASRVPKYKPSKAIKTKLNNK
ncbi:HU family DNA-binding protein [Bacillus infantis]|uniref:HU family DNA-binding protein n=1 Tax=Bacillus infantis TaxID=324767 RepID=UPI003CF6E075